MQRVGEGAEADVGDDARAAGADLAHQVMITPAGKV